MVMVAARGRKRAGAQGARSAEPDPTPTGALPDAAQEKNSDKGYEINFENTPVATRGESHSRRHLGRRLHDRSARAGHGEPLFRARGSAKRSAVCLESAFA